MTKAVTRKTLRWKVAQWLEIRWWKNYLSGKSPAAYLEQKADYWKRVLASLNIHLQPGEKVMDAGCGPAGVFLILEDQQVDAVDPLIDQYRESIPHFEATKYPWVSFHSAPFEDFPIQGAYDTVFCLNAINHFSDWQRGIDQLCLATRRGGQLVLGIDVHNHKSLKFIFKNIPGDVLHPHQHDREDYRQVFQQNGFDIIKEYTWTKGFVFDYWLIVFTKK